MGEAFENWFKNEMLPAECDDERVMVGMRLCWDDRQAEIDRLKEEMNKRTLKASKMFDITQSGPLTEEEQRKISLNIMDLLIDDNNHSNLSLLLARFQLTVDEASIERDRYRWALEMIASFSDYLDGRDGCIRMKAIAREALEVGDE